MAKDTEPKPLSWKPRRRGAIYCSPACGHGCTYAEFERVTREAGELAKSLGPGWKPKVWENMGWHYKVVARGGTMKVHPSGPKPYHYTAFLGEGDGGRWAESAPTAKQAIEDTLEVAKADIEHLQGILDAYLEGQFVVGNLPLSERP